MVANIGGKEAYLYINVKIFFQEKVFVCPMSRTKSKSEMCHHS